nr:ABC transporter ATP-binding protein [Pedobacter sp. ASV28]
MNSYFIFFHKYKKALLFAPLLVVIDVCCEIVQPELMSKIVDTGISQKNLSFVYQIGGVMILLSLIAIVANIGNIYYSSQASVGFATELRKGMFEKIQEFSFADLDRFSSASLTTRITNDVNILQEVIMMSLRLLIRAPLMLLFAVVIAVRINASLASIIAVAIPVLATAIYLILKRGIPFFEKMQQRLDQLNGVVEENLMNVRVVKSFARADFEEHKFSLKNQHLQKMAVKASGTVILIMPIMQLVMNVSIVAIVWFGGNKIMSNTFHIGQLMSFITYITQILMSLMMLSMTIMSLSRAQASSERILDVLHTSPSISNSEISITKDLKLTQGKIEFRDVCFSYHTLGKKTLLKNISFTVSPAETVAIIGTTGSAKSTLVQLIPRLYDISSGHIYIDDHDIKDYTLANLRAGVNLVLQQNQLFSGTIAENLKWGNTQATSQQLHTAARYAQAHGFIMGFPNQYQTVLGQGGVNLSGGQKQRLCLARAILSQPLILIMDDSTSAVDVTTEAKIRSLFNLYLKNTTIIIIAQRISSIQSADRILLLDQGEIIANGTHSVLLKTSQLYREICRSQQLQPTIK